MPISVILLACVLVCPLTMAAMMLFMRHGHGREGESKAKERERQ